MIDDPRLAELGQFTPEGHLQPGYGDHYVFFVGRDDCHGILHHLIPQERLLFKLNMFGYDDDELNADIMGLFDDPAVHVQATLDRSQAGGVHERKIVEFDQQTNSEDFNYSFAIGHSETHQISHTKGGILVGQGIGFEGSMNWSDSGEGTGISLRADVANPAGFKAQNNTLMVSTNPVFLSRFGARLDVEHRVAVQQAHDRSLRDIAKRAAAAATAAARSPIGGAVMTADHRYVLGIAFKAGRNDLVKRGADGKRDIASADVIEQAAWNFMKGSRDIGVEHADGTVGHATVVESYIHRGDPTTFPLDDGESVTVDPGDWVIGAILDDPAWNLYKAGKITGWSPQGTARRRPIRSNP